VRLANIVKDGFPFGRPGKTAFVIYSDRGGGSVDSVITDTAALAAHAQAACIDEGMQAILQSPAWDGFCKRCFDLRQHSAIRKSGDDSLNGGQCVIWQRPGHVCSFVARNLLCATKFVNAQLGEVWRNNSALRATLACARRQARLLFISKWQSAELYRR
jgi:hypothetical protein